MNPFMSALSRIFGLLTQFWIYHYVFQLTLVKVGREIQIKCTFKRYAKGLILQFHCYKEVSYCTSLCIVMFTHCLINYIKLFMYFWSYFLVNSIFFFFQTMPPPLIALRENMPKTSLGLEMTLFCWFMIVGREVCWLDFDIFLLSPQCMFSELTVFRK